MPIIKPMSEPAKVITQQTQPKIQVKANTTANPDAISAEIPASTAAPSDQNTNVEAKPAEVTKPLPPEYAALARKESALRTREKDLQAKEAAIKAKETELESAQGFKEKLKASPLEVLNELGITYDQLVEQAVNQPDPKTRQFESKLDTLEKTLSKQAEDAANREKQQRDQAISQIRSNVKSLVESNPEFETIKGTDNAEDVVNLIVRTFDESGTMLTVEQAAKQVEDDLLEEAVKIASLGKVKAKLTPQAVEPTKQQSHEQQPIKTLTNNMTASKPMSARERAIRRFNGEKF